MELEQCQDSKRAVAKSPSASARPQAQAQVVSRGIRRHISPLQIIPTPNTRPLQIKLSSRHITMNSSIANSTFITNKEAKDEEKSYKGLFGHRELSVDGANSVVAFYGGRQSGAIFSTFFPATFWDDGDRHSSLEGYFQYQKAKKFGDKEAMEKIINTKSPSIQRKLGENIKGFDEAVWAQVRDDVMRTGLRLKFEQNSGLRHRLLMTHNASLCEATANEKYWACGLNLNHKDLPNKAAWPGENKLGIMLMQLRDTLHY